MEQASQEYEMLDLLAYKCNNLLANLQRAATSKCKADALQEYLEDADQKADVVPDFSTEMDWFNVTEPLSFQRQLKGKIVVLDFFTYCCINCMHILPDLKELEERHPISDGLVVIGVHSPKFDNEKASSNILSAIQRYNITHPVVNDDKLTLWTAMSIQCWPTLLVIGPNGTPLFVLMGEGHTKELNIFLEAAFKFYKNSGSLSSHSLPISLASELLKPTTLKFPGKIACRELAHTKCTDDVTDKPSGIYAVSDSGNHRILVFGANGRILYTIGGTESGLVDGDFRVARFNAPQGVSFFTDDILYVADTENHAIREINLTGQMVKTIAGNGKQCCDREGGAIGTAQGISSPWDLLIFRTPNMDMSFHPDDEATPEKSVILIAMAGTHQIWALFINEMIWWKFRVTSEGTCMAIAGNGNEENRNNSYPLKAAFAQPSGLALSGKDKELYIADSESSSVRKLSLLTGRVMNVAGGDRNPLNLFEFGDSDGGKNVARFQHPLGLAHNPNQNLVYVADTYNHKIKVIDVATNIVSTYPVNDAQGKPIPLNEPSALCMSPCNGSLYICNTNHHSIVVIDLATSTASTLKLRTDNEPQPSTKTLRPFKTLTSPPLVLNNRDSAHITLTLNVTAGGGSKFTDAPQSWKLNLPHPTWTPDEQSGNFVSAGSVDSSSASSVLSAIIDIDVTKLDSHTTQPNSIEVAYKLSLCADAKGICFPKFFNLIIPMEYSAAGPSNTKYSANVYVDLQRIQWVSDAI